MWFFRGSGHVPRNVLVLLCVICMSAQMATAMDLYVSPEGRDVWSGTIASPNPAGTDGPFATPEAARDAIRALNQTDRLPADGVTVWLRGGVYERQEALALTADDSGTADAPIVYRAYPDEEVRLVGGREIEGFRPLKDPAVANRIDPRARKHVLQCDLAALGITEYGELRQRYTTGSPAPMDLFYEGRAMTLARWPNHGYVMIADTPAGKDGGRFTYYGDRPERWREAEDPWLHGFWMWDWSDSYQKIEAIDAPAKELIIEPPQHHYGYRPGARYYALNLLEELDAPGEWYLNRDTGLLYFWPPDRLGDRKPVVSVMSAPLFALKGASYVTIRGIVMEYARGNAVEIDGGTHNLVAGCTIRNVGNWGAVISGGTSNGVTGCDIYQTGAGGVVLGGGDRKTLTPAGNFVENCHIHHYSRWSKCYLTGVNISGVGNRIAHNRFHDAPHKAILLTGNDHLIEYNDIYRVSLEVSDAGGFYLGRDYSERGNVVRHNFFHHMGQADVRAVYLDDCASGTTVFGNIFHEARHAVWVGGGRDNRIENNLFVDCEPAVTVDDRGMTWLHMTVGIMKERLEAVNYHQPPYSERYPELAQLDVYYDEHEGRIPPEGNTIIHNVVVGDTWRLPDLPGVERMIEVRDNSVGADRESIEFRDGCPQLKRDSPAYEMGFERIDVRQIGPYRDEYRAELPAGREIVVSSLEVIEQPVHHEDGTRAPGKVRLVLRNAGEVPASGVYRFQAGFDGGTEVRGSDRFGYRLKPGESKAKVFDYDVLDDSLETVMISATPEDSYVTPIWSFSHVRRGYIVPRTPEPATLDDLPTALARATWRAVGGHGRFRMAVAGGSLAFHAEIVDKALARKEPWWEGSCLEVFGAMPDSGSIGQVVFLPQAPDAEARLTSYLHGKELLAADFPWRCDIAGQSYDLLALIPLEMLAIDEGSDRFMMELSVNGSPVDVIHRERLFGSARPASSTEYYGRMNVSD